MTVADERQQLAAALAALEAQRAILGDAVVDAGTKPLRDRLAQLDSVPPAEQRKQVTVLFADVSGFTALSETLDAEEVRDLVNALWARLDAAITAEGGYVDKHIGDAVMALFGVPRSREDDAERAVRAALAMQAALSEAMADMTDDRAPHVRLAMRIGLNTGPVIVGEVGSTAEYTALGDTVNLASRLEGLAPVGGVLISASTHALVRGLFETEERPPAQVKGKAEPVATHVVLRAAPRAFHDPRRRLDRARTRFQGREAELVLLRAAVDEARGARVFRGLLLVADAGLGKSRLLLELDEDLTVAAPGLAILRARALPELAGEPLGLLRAALLSHWGVRDTDEAAVAAARILAATGAAGEVHAQALAELSGVVPMPPGGDAAAAEARRELAFHALRSYLASLPEGALLLLEDLHWADDASLEAVAFLAREKPAGVALLATARPELVRAHGDIVADLEHVRLAPLAPDVAAALAADLIGPGERAGEAAALAEGNPFFLEELARMVAEPHLGGAALPTTLAGVLQARLEAMPPAASEACQAAAVIGRSFWDRALAYLASDAGDGPLPPEWEGGLGEAVAQEIVEPVESSMADLRQFDFRHALLHEAAYESVLLRQRRTWHAQAARWLIARNPARADERAALIARHFARSTTPADAVPWLRTAGERAFAAYANQEAVDHFSSALELALADAELRFELLRGRERALDRLGQRDAQAADLAALLEVAPGLGPLAEAQALLQRADFLWSTGDLPGAAATATEALTLAAAADSAHLSGEAERQLGRLAREAGEATAAQEHFAAAARHVGDAPSAQRANLLVQIGVVRAEDGDLSGALESFESGLATARAAGDTWDEAWALDNIAIVHAQRGDLSSALTAGQESLALAESTGSLFRQVQNRINLALFMNRVGDLAGALAASAVAADQAARIRDSYGAALAALAHAAAQVGLGRADEARAEFAALLPAAAEAGEHLELACQLGGAEALLAGAEWDEAAAAADTVAVRVGEREPGTAALARALQARALLAAGRVDDALSASAEAIAHLTAIVDMWDADRIWFARYLALDAAGDPEAAAALDTAGAALELKLSRIGAPALRTQLVEHVPAAAEIAARYGLSLRT